MKNVERPACPAILTSKSKQWKKELLDAIKDVNARNKRLKEGEKKHKVSATTWNRYNNVEVKNALKEMYGKPHGGLCCYCEQRVGHVAHEHIEHRQPKSLFPELTFDWENLHLVCPICNIAKGNEWDATHSILDAAKHKDINQLHMSYEITTISVNRVAISDEGGTTILHADLNRPDLADLASNGTRPKVILGMVDTVSKIREIEFEDPDSPRVVSAKKALKKGFDGELGSLVEFYARKMLHGI